MVGQSVFTDTGSLLLHGLPRKLGILGGSFDPCHLGHIEMCAAVRDEFSLGRILLLTAADPPHKSELAPASDRLTMCELAAAGHPFIEVSRLEMRPGVIYTVDTLTLIRQSYDGEICYIIGSDTLFELTNWRRFPEVARLTSFICVPRAGEDCSRIDGQVEYLTECFGAEIKLSAARPMDISSTEVRAAVRAGQDVTRYTGAAVAGYIRANGLYR